MTDLRNLNKAVQSAEFPSHEFAQAVREWIAAATEKLNGESGHGADFGYTPTGEPRKVVCRKCGKLTSELHEFNFYPMGCYFTCQVEPAPPSGKVECPNCKRPVKHDREHTVYLTNSFICDRYEPAAPRETPKGMAGVCYSIDGEQWHEPGSCPHCTKPAAPEMPEVVRLAVGTLREFARNLAMRDGFYSAHDSRVVRESADALESWWRSQPAPAVAMTEELRNLLIFVDSTCSLRCDEGWRPETLEAMKKTADAVRAQAVEPQGVKLGKVWAYFQSLSLLPQYDNAEGREFLARMFAEIDAAEGKVTG